MAQVRLRKMSESSLNAVQTMPEALPLHVAIIMDGNHRWAKRRHLPGAAGHRAGAKNVRVIAEACADYGVQCLTLFAFSTENWQRPQRGVSLLMDLMRNVLERALEELHKRACASSVTAAAFPPIYRCG